MAPGTEDCQARRPGTVHMVAEPHPLVRTSMLAALLAAEEHREYPAVGFVNGFDRCAPASALIHPRCGPASR
jgi:hypothetical protein